MSTALPWKRWFRRLAWPRLATRSDASPLLFLCAALLLPRFADAQTWHGHVEVIDGVEHVFNPNFPMIEPETIEAEEQWRISEDSAEFMFGIIAEIVVDADGRVLFLDKQRNEIVLADTDGNLLARLGREGDGPGEYRRPADLFVRADGGIGIVQTAPGKVVLLSQEGDPEGNHPLPQTDTGRAYFLHSALPSIDRLIVGIHTRHRSESEIELLDALVAIDSQGTEIARYRERNRSRSLLDHRYVEQKQPFKFPWQWLLGFDNKIISSNGFDRYEIQYHRPDGGLYLIVHRDYDSSERPAQVYESLQAFYAEAYAGRQRGGKEIVFEVSRTNKDIEELFIGADGNLWILTGRGAFETDEGEIAKFDVIDARGRFIRQVTVLGEGNFFRDDFYLLGDRLFVVTNIRADAVVGNTSIGDEAGVEDLQYEVICYRL